MEPWWDGAAQWWLLWPLWWPQETWPVLELPFFSCAVNQAIATVCFYEIALRKRV